MHSHRTTIHLRTVSGLTDPFCNVEYDTGKAVLVNPYFLIVGYLSQFAIELFMGSALRQWPNFGSSLVLALVFLCGLPDIGEFFWYIANYSSSIERGAKVSWHFGCLMRSCPAKDAIGTGTVLGSLR